MNTFAARITAVALATVATLAPLATTATAEEFSVAGAPGLVHVVDAAGEARCEATVVAPKAVLASADCVLENGKAVAAKDLKVVEGDTTNAVSIVWVHADAPATNLALITVTHTFDSDPVALDTFSLNEKHPALSANVAWINGITDALAAEETKTVLAEPVAVAPATNVVPAAKNPIRHFMRVER